MAIRKPLTYKRLLKTGCVDRSLWTANVHVTWEIARRLNIVKENVLFGRISRRLFVTACLVCRCFSRGRIAWRARRVAGGQAAGWGTDRPEAMPNGDKSAMPCNSRSGRVAGTGTRRQTHLADPEQSIG